VAGVGLVALGLPGLTVHKTLRDAHTLLAAGQFAAAVERCQSVLRDNPSNGEARELLGICYYDARRWKEAAAELRTATELRRRYAETYVLLARSCVQLGERAEAEAAYLEALAVDPADRNARRELAMLRQELRRAEAAVPQR
jgi:Flp pilus assembly protein TadD